MLILRGQPQVRTWRNGFVYYLCSKLLGARARLFEGRGALAPPSVASVIYRTVRCPTYRVPQANAYASANGLRKRAYEGPKTTSPLRLRVHLSAGSASETPLKVECYSNRDRDRGQDCVFGKGHGEA